MKLLVLVPPLSVCVCVFLTVSCVHKERRTFAVVQPMPGKVG